MRHCSIDNRGSVCVIIILMLPFVLAAMLLSIDLARITIERARLDVAVDRAAHSGASATAHILNKIAVANWEINKAWRDLERDLTDKSKKDKETKDRKIREYEDALNGQTNEITMLNDKIPTHTKAIAEATFASNIVNAEILVKPPSPIGITDNDNDDQTGNVRHHHITGTIFTDPDDVESGSYSNTRYYAKSRGADAVTTVTAKKKIVPTFFGYLTGPLTITSSSSAAAYGGSIEGFARKATDTIEEAEGDLSDGRDSLYRAAIVPMWMAGEEGKGMVH